MNRLPHQVKRLAALGGKWAHDDSQAIQNGHANLETFSPWNTMYVVSVKCKMNEMAFCSGSLFCLPSNLPEHSQESYVELSSLTHLRKSY